MSKVRTLSELQWPRPLPSDFIEARETIKEIFKGHPSVLTLAFYGSAVVAGAEPSVASDLDCFLVYDHQADLGELAGLFHKAQAACWNLGVPVSFEPSNNLQLRLQPQGVVGSAFLEHISKGEIVGLDPIEMVDLSKLRSHHDEAIGYLFTRESLCLQVGMNGKDLFTVYTKLLDAAGHIMRRMIERHPTQQGTLAPQGRGSLIDLYGELYGAELRSRADFLQCTKCEYASLLGYVLDGVVGKDHYQKWVDNEIPSLRAPLAEFVRSNLAILLAS